MRPESAVRSWFEVREVAGLSSPGLLIYRDRVLRNLRKMLAIAGEAGRLRPHIKTHKMREMVEMQRALGITRFKCATIAEGEMAASAGAKDVLPGLPTGRAEPAAAGQPDEALSTYTILGGLRRRSGDCGTVYGGPEPGAQGSGTSGIAGPH